MPWIQQNHLGPVRRRRIRSKRTASSSSSSSDDRVAVINLFVNVASAIFSVPRTALQPFGPPMIEPPCQTSQERERRDTVNRLLEIGFDDNDHHQREQSENNNHQNNVFTLPDAEEETFSRYWTEFGPNPSTYGEVTTLGARQLFSYMHMMHPKQKDGRHDRKQEQFDPMVFYDLGMGRGKLVVQAFLELNIQHSIGIELSPTRYQTAVMAWDTILHEYSAVSSSSSSSSSSPDHHRRLFLRQGDLLEYDWCKDATHVYVASLCFSDTMMNNLGEKLKNSGDGGDESSSFRRLQCLATLKQLPDMEYSRMEYVEMTWTRPYGCPVYFYDFSKGKVK